ncbi:hypothetical protein PAHAL_4G193900 [Panicum hallii]|uniref:Uncharacterized protein n=1 Tax=Panicum hallii TaxID=206008 RepID=A0A2T8JDF6_9POAL|nr:hypothetical protein PAHAL_4G193900 [Panicum hallii]
MHSVSNKRPVILPPPEPYDLLLPGRPIVHCFLRSVHLHPEAPSSSKIPSSYTQQQNRSLSVLPSSYTKQQKAAKLIPLHPVFSSLPLPWLCRASAGLSHYILSRGGTARCTGLRLRIEPACGVASHAGTRFRIRRRADLRAVRGRATTSAGVRICELCGAKTRRLLACTICELCEPGGAEHLCVVPSWTRARGS